METGRISSLLDYDLNEKMQAYAKTGIQEYWVVDVQKKQVYIFRQPKAQVYEVVTVVDQGNISPLCFPDLKISLQKFWQHL